MQPAARDRQRTIKTCGAGAGHGRRAVALRTEFRCAGHCEVAGARQKATVVGKTRADGRGAVDSQRAAGECEVFLADQTVDGLVTATESGGADRRATHVDGDIVGSAGQRWRGAPVGADIPEAISIRHPVDRHGADARRKSCGHDSGRERAQTENGR